MNRIGALSAVLLLAGCATPSIVAEPGEITLDAALTEVANGIYNLQKTTEGRPKAGLILDEVSVSLNVSAKATNTGTTGATIGNVPLNIGGVGGLTVSNTMVGEGNRGNTITMKFKNLATADLSKGDIDVVRLCFREPKNPICGNIQFSVP